MFYALQVQKSYINFSLSAVSIDNPQANRYSFATKVILIFSAFYFKKIYLFYLQKSLIKIHELANIEAIF